MSKNKKLREGIVYSTIPDFEYQFEENTEGVRTQKKRFRKPLNSLNL